MYLYNLFVVILYVPTSIGCDGGIDWRWSNGEGNSSLFRRTKCNQVPILTKLLFYVNFFCKEEPQEAPAPKLLSLREDPDFISDVIACSAQLLKKIPQAVYRIVPLFTVITENWGPSYIEPSLHLIFKEFHETVVLLQETPLHSPVYQQLYSLVLLLIFLFEVWLWAFLTEFYWFILF